MSGKRKIAILLLVVVSILMAGVVLRTKHHLAPAKMDDKAYFKLFREVIALVKKNYVEPVDDKKLLDSAINGMLASLDPHSAYMPPEPFQEMNIQMSGSFGGLGIELSMKNDKLTVISPIQDTPAFRAGIRSNDHIYRIDDKFTKGLRIDESVKLMRGKEGTKVTLTIMREGVGSPLVFPLVRAIIRTTSLKYRIVEPGYGYISISQFQERTGEDFEKALQTLKSQNKGDLKGLVLDLRYNPGGLVDSAVKVASRFVGEGFNSDGTIVSIKGRETSSNRTLYATVGEKEPRYPLVVLINGGSASASEILAGALQDHRRAVIMGTQSFGKGSVQNVLPLRAGAGLKLTTAKYYTPKGRSIQAKGITPDIIVATMDLTAVQNKEDKPFHEKDLVNHISAGHEKTKIPEPVKSKQKVEPVTDKGSAPDKKPVAVADEQSAKDYQLSRALELLKGMDLMQQTTQIKK